MRHMIRILALIVILFWYNGEAHSQHFSVTLSSKHEGKLNTIKSGHKRLVKYYKFLKRDSLKQAKENRKLLRHKYDSTWRAEKSKV